MVARWLCLLLWRLLGYPASLLGLLPVRGWPLPRPWPTWAATLAALANTLFLILAGRNRYSLYRDWRVQVVATVLILASRVSLLLWRRTLCEAVQCLVLYCGSHPLSAPGWRRMLALTLAIGSLRFPDSVPVVYPPTGNVDIDYLRLLGSSVASFASSLLGLLALAPVAFVGVLLQDLRQDVALLLRGSHAATDTTGSLPRFTRREQRDLDLEEGAQRWRSLRVRQQMLLDLLSMLKPSLQFCQLYVVLMDARTTVLHFSTSLVAYDEGGLQTVAVLHLLCAVASLVRLVATFGVLDWPRDEVRF